MNTDSKIITVKGYRDHTKASERYVDVTLHFTNGINYETSIPIIYRRTGTEIDQDGVEAYLKKVYEELIPERWEAWKKEQDEFWAEKPGASTTKGFFSVLSEDFTWCCTGCRLPQNPNWARRIQDIKEFGYTLATDTNHRCTRCQKNTTHLILVPIKRGGITGYETWSPALRSRILTTLKTYDCFEAKGVKKEGLLPDHKFPEIRWEHDTRRNSLDELTDEQIKHDFQLLSNQRNQQKREVCRSCFQTNKRGIIYGIPYFYRGSDTWDPSIPKTGKEAESGCLGCGWYDIEEWRRSLVRKLTST